MILGKLANLIDFRFLHVCVQNIKNLAFKIWEMIEMVKTDVDGLLLVLIIKKLFRYILLKLNLFFIFETKSSLSTSVFIFFAISQILKNQGQVR